MRHNLGHPNIRDVYNNWMFDNRMTRHMKKLLIFSQFTQLGEIFSERI